ncbi:MAG: histidine triad nucleotide-binding protein [Sinobacterium sp.]|nr:histidine triad nucleotide-binding protein [Sinobacterium sp.]
MSSFEKKVAARSIFTEIIDRNLPAQILYEDDLCIVIKDAHPQAPVHFLVIPKKPLVSLLEIKAEDVPLLGHLNYIAAKVAKQEGCNNGFRLIANNGKQAGQTVFHLHYHVLGRKSLLEQGL